MEDVGLGELRRWRSAAAGLNWAAAAWLALWLVLTAGLGSGRGGGAPDAGTPPPGAVLSLPVLRTPGAWWLGVALALPAAAALAALERLGSAVASLRARGGPERARALEALVRAGRACVLAWFALPAALVTVPGAPGALTGALTALGVPAEVPLGPVRLAAGMLALDALWAALCAGLAVTGVRVGRTLASAAGRPPGAGAAEAGGAPRPAHAAGAAAPRLSIPSRLGWVGQRRALVAIDLAHGAAKVLQAVRVGQGVAVTAAGRLWLPTDVYRRGQVRDPDALARLLRTGLRELRVATRRAVMAVGGEVSILRTVAFPRMTEEELREALRWEADKFFPFRYEDAVVDFRLLDLSVRQLWPGGRASEGQVPVLLGACRRDAVLPLVAAAEQAELELVELEPHPLAAFRALAYVKGAGRAAGVVALVELGLEGGYVTIFRHGAPVLHRTLARGVFPPGVREALAAGAAAEPPKPDPRELEAVLAEAARSLEVAAVQLRPPRLRVVLTGDGAVFAETGAALERYLSDLFAGRDVLEAPPAVERFTWERAGGWPLPLHERLVLEGPAWAGALGLALRGLGASVPRPPVVDDGEPAPAGTREAEGAAWAT